MVVSEQFEDYSRFIVQIKCNVGCHNPKHVFTKVLTIGWAIRSDWRDCLAQINTVHSSWFKPHKTVYWAQNRGHHPNVLGYMKNKKKISDTCNLGYPCFRKIFLDFREAMRGESQEWTPSVLSFNIVEALSYEDLKALKRCSSAS